ncbi:MAG: response regulator transcription factor [Synechococcales bacterium]|nr:response regulator transcription factor [Synechococcales bacterium]
MSHILIVEDDPRIAAFLAKGFLAKGFTSAIASDDSQAMALVQESRFDLLILDLGLPDKDGLEVLAELRRQGHTLPIIILTARDDIHDKVAGLEGGANDYITKPFRFEELLARVRVQLRSTAVPVGTTADVLHVGKVSLNLHTRQAIVDGANVDLPAREFTMAELFFRHPGHIFSREQLLEQVWGYKHDPGSNVVDVYVGYLRKKFGSHLIETVRGRGYRLRT